MTKLAARIALAIMILSAASVVLPANLSRMNRAAAQILPTPPLPDPTDILKDPPRNPPSPSPSPTEEPPPDPVGGGGGGGGGGSGGGGDSGPAKTKDGPRAKTSGRGARNGGRARSTYPGTFTPQGSFSTERLVAVAARLRSLGAPTRAIMKRVYAPFIIGGNAAWTNTWGAPRYGPARGQIRTHQGQDVFCTSGDPILAGEPGIVDYSRGGLGGLAARLHRPDGSYWYYAHLSGFNDAEFPAGSRVETGDVIGFCGNTGNAASTPSHVHFGWYLASGRAKDPMGHLVRWLHAAERRATGSISKAEGQRIRLAGSFTIARRFGDAFVPSLAPGADGSLLALHLGDPGALTTASSTILAALSPFAGPDGVAAASSSSAAVDAQVRDILQDTGYAHEAGD